MEELKYPIGQYKKPAAITADVLRDCIHVIERFPQQMRQEVEHLTRTQLETSYRPEGWTIRQVVNHCADSHMNALVRHKLALTEDTPVITPYMEALWAELPDCREMPIQPALSILDGVHARWATVLKNISDNDWSRGFIHPEKGREIPLDESAGMYAWHCSHHLAHITELKKRKGWK